MRCTFHASQSMATKFRATFVSLANCEQVRACCISDGILKRQTPDDGKTLTNGTADRKRLKGMRV